MRLKSLITGLAAMFAAAPAIAQEGLQIIGVPTDKGLGFQPQRQNWRATFSGWTV